MNKKKQINRRHCTIPAVLGLREWFEGKFGDLCEVHDYQYYTKTVSRKEADDDLRDGIISRGYYFFGWATWVAVRAIGWYRYNR